MELPTLTMTREQAAEEVARYRTARQHVVLTREDERMLQAYRAIASGKTVIDLHRALALGGIERRPVNEKQIDLPRLAVMRADQRWAWLDGIGRDGTVTFRNIGDSRSYADERRAVGECRLQAVELFPRDDTRQQLSSWTDRTAYRAMLPPVPAPLRPTRSLYGERVERDLKGYAVLWEAEWSLETCVPPGDPALLKHIGGTLYSVEAVWDLTPVEQAVLAGRVPTPAELSWRTQ